MVEGRARYDWNHTASLLAAITNAPRFQPKKPATPADFHPFMPKVKLTITMRELYGNV